MDGKIALHGNHNVDWTSKKDKNFFRSQTQRAGVVIFGANTYRAMGKPMPNRLNVIMTRNPGLYRKKQVPDLLEFTDDSARLILDKLQKRGYTTAVIGGGSVIYSLFLKENLIDTIYLTVVPKIFGTGIPLFQKLNIPTKTCALTNIEKLGKGEFLLKYDLI
jgi:dihydrofolate reductase